MEFKMEKCAMLIRNKTSQSEKYQNAWKKRRLKIAGNIMSGYSEA